MRFYYLTVMVCLLACTACRKSEELTTDRKAKLSFSADTVLFDTVFTTAGSVNKRIKVYNNNLKAISISTIKLGGGSSSYFNLIINGQPASQMSNLHIDGRDSISIYVQATINANDQTEPFIVQDSILFETNGNKQSVALVAYGQNAVFMNNKIIEANTTWTSALPYVIYKSVTVARGASLKILAGTKVLFHGNSVMNVKGTLRAQGTAVNPVVFAGDRFESMYAEEPGQWKGIHFYSSSSNSELHYTRIKNAVIGITADSLQAGSGTKLSLTNSAIQNMAIAGFAGYHTSLKAFNNLFSNAGQYLLYSVDGGSYNLKQNTFVNYSTGFARKTPSLYFSDAGNGLFAGSLSAVLVNNIIWGSAAEELLIEKKAEGGAEAIVRNNLIKTLLKTYGDNFNLLNADPKFSDPGKDSFELKDDSPALNKGADLSSDADFNKFLNRDLNNKLRLFPSELGCYERN